MQCMVEMVYIMGQAFVGAIDQRNDLGEQTLA